ncbi:hypothetical protein PanWU01x14_165460, partial [Parasponia andersonii]
SWWSLCYNINFLDSKILINILFFFFVFLLLIIFLFLIYLPYIFVLKVLELFLKLFFVLESVPIVSSHFLLKGRMRISCNINISTVCEGEDKATILPLSSEVVLL